MQHGSRVSQLVLNRPCHRMITTEHAPGYPFCVLERCYGLFEIVDRGAGVLVKRRRVS